MKACASAFLVAVGALFLSGCGVKGDPIPPQSPPHLGRGEPTYRRATEEFAFPEIPGVHDKKESEEK